MKKLLVVILLLAIGGLMILSRQHKSSPAESETLNMITAPVSAGAVSSVTSAPADVKPRKVTLVIDPQLGK